MRKFFSGFWGSLRSMDRNDKTYWLGLAMLFVGLTFIWSVFVALTVVGVCMAVESAITSYLVAWFNARQGSNK